MMASDEEKFVLIDNLSKDAEVGKLDEFFGLMRYFSDDQRLFSYEKGLVKLYFKWVQTIYPEIGTVFATLISQYVFLTDAEMFLTDDFGSQVDWSGGWICPLLLCFFFAAEDCFFISREGVFGVDFLIIMFGFEDGKLQIEEERIIGKGEFVSGNIERNVLGIFHLSEGEFLTFCRFIHFTIISI